MKITKSVEVELDYTPRYAVLNYAGEVVATARNSIGAGAITNNFNEKFPWNEYSYVAVTD